MASRPLGDAADDAAPRKAAAAIAPWRARLDARIAATVDPLVHGLLRHWLVLVNLALALFLGMAFLAPLLMQLGAERPARWIYSAYALVCHQWAFRSFFLFGQQVVYPRDQLESLFGRQAAYSLLGNPQLGYKVAFCERDVAIYGAMLIVGLLFARVRGRLRPPSMLMLGIALAPIALDGFTQLFGWRESTWELRTLTGAIFGVAAVWLIYPQLERSSGRALRRYGLA